MSDPLTGAPLKWRDPQTLPRGYGYPETGTDLVKGFTDQQQRLRHSDPAYTPSDFLKHHFSSKYQWDGSVTTFREYKQHVEGFYIQQKAWFIFNPTFRQLYCKHGLNCISHPKLPLLINLTKQMLIHTRQHLFGAIQISTRKAVTVHKYLNKYRDT